MQIIYSTNGINFQSFLYSNICILKLHFLVGYDEDTGTLLIFASNQTQEDHAHLLLIYISPLFFFWHYRKRAEWLLFPSAQITPVGI